MLATLLALLIAFGALYLANVVGNVVNAICHAEAEIKEPIPDDRGFADYACTPDFLLLLSTAAVASQGASWSVGIPLCLAGLSIARLPKYICMWPRAVEIGAEWQVMLAVAVSSVHSLAAAICMAIIGAGVSWILH